MNDRREGSEVQKEFFGCERIEFIQFK